MMLLDPLSKKTKKKKENKLDTSWIRDVEEGNKRNGSRKLAWAWLSKVERKVCITCHLWVPIDMHVLIIHIIWVGQWWKSLWLSPRTYFQTLILKDRQTEKSCKGFGSNLIRQSRQNPTMESFSVLFFNIRQTNGTQKPRCTHAQLFHFIFFIISLVLCLKKWCLSQSLTLGLWW